MKKLSIIAAFAGIFISQLNTQAQGLYAGLGVGYGFPSQVGAFYPGSSSSGGSVTTTSQSYSLGAGMAVGVYGGYMISKNFGIELGISDKLSSSTSTTGTSVDTGFNYTTTNSDVYTAKGSLFRLTPGIRIATSCDGKLQGYSVIGLIIGFPSATLEDNGTSTTVTTNPVTSTTNQFDMIYTYSGGMIIGFHGSLGVMYQVSDMIGIFGEINGNFQNWAPTKRLITTYTVNGVDQTSQSYFTTQFKETDYVSSYTTSASSSSPGSPTQAPLMYLPFSSWGLTVGIHFNFGGGSSSK